MVTTTHLNTISADLSISRRISTRKLRFDPRPVHVEFVVDNVELEAARSSFDPREQASLRYNGFI